MYSSNAASDGGGCQRGAPPRPARCPATRPASEDTSPKRSALHDVGQQAAVVQAHDPGGDDQLLGLELDAPDDDRGGADGHAHFDRGGAAERCGDRQLQSIESGHTIVAADHLEVRSLQRVGHERGEPLAQPQHPGVPSRVVERQDEDRTSLRQLGRVGRWGGSEQAKSQGHARHHPGGAEPGASGPGPRTVSLSRHPVCASSTSTTPFTPHSFRHSVYADA